MYYVASLAKYSRDSGAAGDPVSVYGRAGRKACTAYLRIEPSPVTGKPRGACPGYVIDHVIPLCAGGANDPLNMQWPTRPDSVECEEAQGCRHIWAEWRPGPLALQIRDCLTSIVAAVSGTM